MEDAHHFHAWLLDETECALEAHVVVAPERIEETEAIKRQVGHVLDERFGIHHSTLELEYPSASRDATHSTTLINGGSGYSPHEESRQ